MIRLRRTCKVTDNPKTSATLCSQNLTPTSTSSSTSLPHPPQPPFHIPSCASSTSTKPMSPTSVDRHRGHRLTDIGDVGLEAVEEDEMRKWGVVTCGSFGNYHRDTPSHEGFDLSFFEKDALSSCAQGERCARRRGRSSRSTSPRRPSRS